MNFKSFQTLRTHQIDLRVAHDRGRIEKPLLHYIVNRYDDGKLKLPMQSLAYQIAKSWPAVGILDLHDLTQIYYLYLLKAYNNVKWDKIEASKDPDAALWAYLKKSAQLKVRIEINNLKDGMRIPEKKQFFDGKGVENFFSDPRDQVWFWIKDEVLALLDSPPDRWETEQQNIALGEAMRKVLSPTERLILEYNFGIDGAQKSFKEIGKTFGMTESNVRKVKSRALSKLRDNEEVMEYLEKMWLN